MAIVWKEISVNGARAVPAVLKVGARVDGEAPSYPIALSEPGNNGSYFTIHPELVAISPDGLHLAVLAHAFAGEFSDSFLVAVHDTRQLARSAYNDAGLARHKKGEFRRAAELFEKAVAVDPGAHLPRYNLACAYARLGDPRVKQALEAAIAARAEESKASARKDPDFDSVRGEQWFAALVR
jgi:hypothetical protein